MRATVLLALVLSLAGCSEQKHSADVAEALPTVLVPPQATVVSRERGEEALNIRFHSEMDPGHVADYYRAALSHAPWNLVSDTPTEGGAIALYAERPDGPPLWVTIRKADGAAGSIVDLAGARVGKTK